MEAMYAVVVSGGKQYRVSEGATLVVDRMDSDAGSEISLDRVLLVGGESVLVGTPLVAGAVVKATVVSHEKGEKTEYTHYRRRRRTRTNRNGRSKLTVLKIESISLNVAAA